MAAHIAGVNDVPLVREAGGDKVENVQRDAIDVDERVPPFADVRQSD